MLTKLFKVHKLAHFSRPPSKLVEVEASLQEEHEHEHEHSALKIVHAGGRVDCYFMAIPAARILEKYPSCVVAWPDVFRRPWESVIKPDAILTPGQKYFLVPRYTIRKLRRRTRKPDKNDSSVNSFVSQSFSGLSVGSKDAVPTSKQFFGKSSVNKKKVRFEGEGDGAKPKKGSMVENRDGVVEKPSNGFKSNGPGLKGKKMRSNVNWQPSLASVMETSISSNE